jgi:hypothetical protein
VTIRSSSCILLNSVVKRGMDPSRCSQICSTCIKRPYGLIDLTVPFTTIPFSSTCHTRREVGKRSVKRTTTAALCL